MFGALLVLACKDDQAAVDRYRLQINPALERYVAARENWNSVSLRLISEASNAALDSQQQRELVDAANGAFVASVHAAKEIGAVVPPRECDGVHALLLDGIGKSELGYLDMKSYYEGSLRTGNPDEEVRARANDNIAASNTVRSQLLIEQARTHCNWEKASK